MKPIIKQAITYYACIQLQIELLDRLKSTNLYKQNLKNLCNKLQAENEKSIINLFGKLDDEAEKYFHKSVTMVESFLEVIERNDIDVFMGLMDAFRNGEIGVLNENKHTKIFKQLEKL
jgi:hypothetical protein